jgi:exopolysaccharide production protein ExoQ
MRVPVKLLNAAFTVVVLFLAIGAFQSLVMDVSNPETLTRGSTALQVVWSCIYVVVALRALPLYRQMGSFIRSNKLLIFLLALTVLSTLWSGDPGLTFRRSIGVLGTTLFGIDFALRYPIRDQLRMLCFVLGLTVLLDLIVQVCWPGSIPIVDAAYGEGWNGGFLQKNVFARIIVLTTLAFIMRSSGRRKIVKDGLVTLCALALIVASESRTALVLLPTLLLLLAIVRFLLSTRRSRVAYVVCIVMGLAILYLASVNLDYLTGMLDRDSTLTGRVDIWQMAFASFLKRPLLGYGYSAFWNVSPDAFRINSVMNWTVPHAHNGFLDLALQLGLLGLCLYLTYYVVSVIRAVEYARSNSSVEAMWPFAYLAFTFLYSITEGSLLSSNSIFWILYTSVACSVAAAPVFHGRCGNCGTSAESATGQGARVTHGLGSWEDFWVYARAGRDHRSME